MLKPKVPSNLGSRIRRGLGERARRDEHGQKKGKRKKQTQSSGFMTGSLFPPSLPLRSREIKIPVLCQGLKGV